MPVEHGANIAMDANQLMNHVAIGGLSTGTWLADPVKVYRYGARSPLLNVADPFRSNESRR
jgi:hypothetical protein